MSASTYTQLSEARHDKGMTAGKLRTTLTPAERIAWYITDDLRDRRGLRHEYDRIDEEIRDEIFEVWKKIVQAELNRLAPRASGPEDGKK